MPSTQLPLFADARASYREARYIILGIPFDRTTSFRPGARFAPDVVRQQSWNFESYNYETDLDLSDVPIHDLGNSEEFGSAEEMAEGVRELLTPIWRAGKFPITLGGDHSCSVPVLEAVDRSRSLGVLYLDAHLDFRDHYLNDRRSHACSARRMVELLGADRVVHLGVRSMSQDEKRDNDRLGMRVHPSDAFRERGARAVADLALQELGTKEVYITLDIDVVDPSFAPATGTPEPFGLNPVDVKTIIGAAADRLVGIDIMEVSPPWDHGNTALLAARLAREAILRVEHRRGGARPRRGAVRASRAQRIRTDSRLDGARVSIPK